MRARLHYRNGRRVGQEKIDVRVHSVSVMNSSFQLPANLRSKSLRYKILQNFNTISIEKCDLFTFSGKSDKLCGRDNSLALLRSQLR